MFVKRHGLHRLNICVLANVNNTKAIDGHVILYTIDYKIRKHNKYKPTFGINGV